MLWEAAYLADPASPPGQHILSNIAIGEFERGNLDKFEYAKAKIDQANANYGKLINAYIEGLHETLMGRPVVAEQLLLGLLLHTNEGSYRLKVYLLELLATSLSAQERAKEALACLERANQLRKQFLMHPSTVEKRRLGKLRRQLNLRENR
jgi:hypothetical protein